jgi:caffeoyl-CoA O-methyltransferase
MKSDRTWMPENQDLDWIEATAGEPHPVFLAMESLAEPAGIPILDRASGRVLATLAANRSSVVEVGTAIGYSTLWMALAQPAGGRIVTIDPDAGRTDLAREYWRQADIPDEQIEVVNAPALVAFAAGVPELAGPFDLAFVDALKDEYPAYLAALRSRLASGALLVADNVLWGGRTSGARPPRPGDGTEALRQFCREVLGDARFRGTILPVGDGLLVATWRP